MMIICLFGTRAQLIKMAPVILCLEKRKMDAVIILTGQHQETMQELMTDFGIKSKVQYLYSGPEITGIYQMAKWFLYCLKTVNKEISNFIPNVKQERNVILVHGDTFSTLLGAVIGKIKKIPVAHIESGLRSFNIFHPFPEELTRIITLRLSDYAFCPGDWAYNNVQGYRLDAINTESNTLLDAVIFALNNSKKDPLNDAEEAYCVCSIHRFENIFFKKRFVEIIGLIELAAEQCKVLFVLHPATRKKLLQFELMGVLECNSNIQLLDRMGYIKFIQLIGGAKFVITDGGGNQEELSYLGIPTCLMRKTTERKEGLKTNVSICAYEKKLFKKFINTTKAHPPSKMEIPKRSPSSIIVDYLEHYG